MAILRKNALPILLFIDLLFSRFHWIFHRFVLHFHYSTDHQKSSTRKEKWSQRIDENDGITALDELVFPLFGRDRFGDREFDHYRDHDQSALERQ